MNAELLAQTTPDDLRTLGINALGDIKTILKYFTPSQATTNAVAQPNTQQEQFMKTPAAKPPQILVDMTRPQFRKFKTDWIVYKRISNLHANQIHAQLYHTCDSLVNTVTDFFTLTEDTLEDIVTRKSNPAVHRLHFSTLCQSNGESIKDFLVRLKSVAPDCEYSCPSCHHDLQPTHIKDQPYTWST